MIFDIVECIIMEWTMPNESRICRICRRLLILKKRRRVLLASLSKKLNREDYEVDKYLVLLAVEKE